MSKDSTELEFEKIDGLKDQTFKLIQENKELFEQYIISRDNNILNIIIENLLRDDYYKDAELKRMESIVRILINELENTEGPSFCDGITSYRDIYDKYIEIILLLRRIEMAANDGFSKISYEVLPTISIQAILVIINSEYYERKEYILENMYSNCKATLSDNMKLKWLTKIIELYSGDYWYLELASLYMDYGQFSNALIFLEKVNNPNEDIKELITTLKNSIGGTR